MKQAMMSWQTLHQLKGQSVQSYTQEFYKRALTLGISLDSPKTLLKYIGGLHSYLRHTILMFNPTSLDDVSVQATHLEARGKNVTQDVGKSSKPIERKNKGKKEPKWKEKKTNTVKKDKTSCTHCKKEGHDEARCWSLHPELKPRMFESKERKNDVAIQKDLGSDSSDKTTVTTIGIKGKDSKASTSTSSHFVDNDNDERKRNELFHIRVISKHTKIDTLFDSGSHINMISEAIVKNSGLESKPHKRAYPLGCVCDETKLQVTKQCKLRFPIRSKFVDEVELDIVPLDICGIVLGSPYLYDRNYIFYRTKNKYQLIKDVTEYIVRAHKLNVSKAFCFFPPH